MNSDTTTEPLTSTHGKRVGERGLGTRLEGNVLVAVVTAFWVLSFLMAELLGNETVTLVMLPYWLCWGAFLCVQLERMTGKRKCPNCGSEETSYGLSRLNEWRCRKCDASFDRKGVPT